MCPSCVFASSRRSQPGAPRRTNVGR
jgi:hypothetical protein